MVPRSRRGARALSVLGWQGLVRGNLTQSKRTSANPGPGGAGTPAQGGQTGQAAYGQTGQPAYGQTASRAHMASPVQSPYGQGYGSAYANYQEIQKKKSPIGWWIAGGALVIVIVVVAVLAIRAVTGGNTGTTGVPGQPSQDVCPAVSTASPEPDSTTPPMAGCTAVRFPTRCSVAPGARRRETTGCPSGAMCRASSFRSRPTMTATVANWVASVLVGELQAGDGFFTPEQGSQIVVKCILGKFYGDNPVKSNVTVNKATNIDGHDAWLVESKLTFDIAGLTDQGRTVDCGDRLCRQPVRSVLRLDPGYHARARGAGPRRTEEPQGRRLDHASADAERGRMSTAPSDRAPLAWTIERADTLFVCEREGRGSSATSKRSEQLRQCAS